MPRPIPFALLLTCEHGGNRVPAAYRSLFSDGISVLETHRGYDIGALDLAKRLRAKLSAPLQYSTVTRLLIDLNRSPSNPSRFTEFTSAMSREEKHKIQARFHDPYWAQSRSNVTQAIKDHGRALMFSVHTFTPHLFGETRNADVGLLYDPQRPRERQFAKTLQQAINDQTGDLKVRLNYPYQGRNDALPTRLRHEYPRSQFAGLEIEVNQGLWQTERWKPTCVAITAALKQCIVQDHDYPAVLA